MRLVTVSTALALSIAAFSFGAPVSADTVKKQPAAKQESVASVTAVKKASVAPAKKAAVASTKEAAVAPAKKVQDVEYKPAAIAKKAVIGNQRAASVAPVKRSPIVRQPRAVSATQVPADAYAAFGRHGVSEYVNY